MVFLPLNWKNASSPNQIKTSTSLVVLVKNGIIFATFTAQNSVYTVKKSTREAFNASERNKVQPIALMF